MIPLIKKHALELVVLAAFVLTTLIVMTDDKVYTPDWSVPDQPFPNELKGLPPTPTQQGEGVVRPTETKPAEMPRKVIAQETINSSLNTKTRKITSPFQFTESGALQIGKLVPGENGEVKISPAGIIARNSAGDTSFALDGETGDATFAGRITGGSMNINNNFTVDNEGNVVANSIALTDTNASTSAALNQAITSSTKVDITGSSVSLSLERPTIVLLLANISVYAVQDPGSGTAWDIDGVIYFDIDGVEKDSQVIVEGGLDTGTYDGIYGIANTIFPASMHRIETLGAGDHVIKLRSYLLSTTNNGRMIIFEHRMSVVTLGSPL